MGLLHDRAHPSAEGIGEWRAPLEELVQGIDDHRDLHGVDVLIDRDVMQGVVAELLQLNDILWLALLEDLVRALQDGKDVLPYLVVHAPWEAHRV